ncbi:MAG TPA: hypothetical protein VGH28_31520 [Polyangiaceae bacterium]
MKRIFFLGAVFSSLAIAAACSSGSSTDDGGTSDASNDTTQPDSSKTDGSTSDGSTGDAATDATSNQLTLTIQDYLGWCNVTVNDAGPNIGTAQTYAFDPDASVALHGDTANASLFYWGYWGNVNDGGMLSDGGQDINKDVNFNITGNVTLHACCPDNGLPLSQCTF